MRTTVVATHHEHMLLSIFIVKQTRHELTACRHRFAAHWARTLHTWLWLRVAVRASAYVAKLIWHRHRTIHFAHQVFTWHERTVAYRAIYKQPRKRRFFLRRLRFLTIIFIFKEGAPPRKPIEKEE